MQFKRHLDTKESLGIGITHNQRFWYIESISFVDRLDLRSLVIPPTSPGRGEIISYHWVIPVYVYSINTVWDGSKTFDISPIDFSQAENQLKPDSFGWRMSISISPDRDFGQKVFRRENEAWTAFKEKHNYEDNKIIHEKHMEIKKSKGI